MSRTKEETIMKKTLIIAGLLTVLLAGCSTAPSIDTSSTTSTQTETTQTETTSDTAPVADTKQEDNNVPTEYKSALRSAKNYSDMMHMSKQGIYDQLTSEYGDKFTAEAAQYGLIILMLIIRKMPLNLLKHIKKQWQCHQLQSKIN